MLLAEATPSVICLVFVKFLNLSFKATGLWKGPLWLVLMNRRFVCLELWGVSSWSHGGWGGCLVNQSTSVGSFVTESILGGSR